MMETFAVGDVVKIRNVGRFWSGKYGQVVEDLGRGRYMVKIGDKVVMFDAGRGEIVKIRGGRQADSAP